MPRRPGANFCPLCGGDSGVHDSRTRDDGSIRRRRHCVSCEHRWGTVEVSSERLLHLEHIERSLRCLKMEISAALDPVIEAEAVDAA